MPVTAIHMPMQFGLVYQIDPAASTVHEIAEHIRYRKTKPKTAEITLLSDRVELIVTIKRVEQEPNDERLVSFSGHVARATMDGRPIQPSLSYRLVEGVVSIDGQYGNLKLLRQ